MNIINKIENNLQKLLSKPRYEHSLLVAEHAKKLAKIYKINEENAYIAGLVHDSAKEFSDEENSKGIKQDHLSQEWLDPN